MADAKELLIRVLNIRKKQLGEDHRLVGLTLAALAVLLSEKDEKVAITYTMQAFSVLEKAKNKESGNSAS